MTYDVDAIQRTELSCTSKTDVSETYRLFLTFKDGLTAAQNFVLSCVNAPLTNAQREEQTSQLTEICTKRALRYMNYGR